MVVPEWLGLYLGGEQSATRPRCFDPEWVHGLLQTEDYARAVTTAGGFLDPDVIDQRTRFRLDRQRRVFGNRPDLTAVLGAGARGRLG